MAAEILNFSCAVVATFSFNSTAQVWPCTSDSEAEVLLKQLSEAEREVDAANGWEVEYYISPDGQYAKIVDHCPNGVSDTKEWRIGEFMERPSYP